MNMKFFYSILLYLLLGQVGTVHAQTTMGRFLEKTPDGIFEFVTNEMFAKMIDYVNTTIADVQKMDKFELVNRFEEKSVVDTLSSDYVSLSLSSTLQVQMMALPLADADTIVCMVKTYAAPEKESVIYFYDLQWKELDSSDYLSLPSSDELIARPDTMDVERYEELLKWVDPRMIFAQILPQQKSVVFSLATPLLNKDEVMQVNAILLQRKVKWRGKSFNKS